MCLPVNDESEIVFLRYLAPLLDEDLLDLFAKRAGLVCDEDLAEDLSCELSRLVLAPGEFYAPCLAPASGVYLRLYYAYLVALGEELLCDIFRLGRELNDSAQGRVRPGRDVLRIGVVAGIPKTLVHHLLTPALDELNTGAAVIRQGTAQDLLEALAAGRLHLVLTNDVPTPPAGSP